MVEEYSNNLERRATNILEIFVPGCQEQYEILTRNFSSVSTTSTTLNFSPTRDTQRKADFLWDAARMEVSFRTVFINDPNGLERARQLEPELIDKLAANYQTYIQLIKPLVDKVRQGEDVSSTTDAEA